MAVSYSPTYVSAGANPSVDWDFQAVAPPRVVEAVPPDFQSVRACIMLDFYDSCQLGSIVVVLAAPGHDDTGVLGDHSPKRAVALTDGAGVCRRSGREYGRHGQCG